MSRRREKSRKFSRTMAYLGAALIHLAIIGAVLINFTTEKDTQVVEAFDADTVDIVKATTITDEQIKQRNTQQEEQKRLQQQAEKEQQEAEKEQQEAEKEQQERARLEQQRKQIALKKQQEEQKKRAERQRKEKLEKQRRAKRAAERKKQAAREREQKAAQEQLNQLLLEEERLRAQQDAERRALQRTTTLISRYSSLIKDAINAVRTVPPAVERWRTTKVNITLSATGDVIDINIIEPSGNAIYDRSVLTAIRQASPLPIASESEDAQAHIQLRDITINFTVPRAG